MSRRQPRPHPHLYEADLSAAADHRGQRPCRWCPLPVSNRVHDEDAIAQVDAAQAEHRRRIGEDH